MNSEVAVFGTIGACFPVRSDRERHHGRVNGHDTHKKAALNLGAAAAIPILTIIIALGAALCGTAMASAPRQVVTISSAKLSRPLSAGKIAKLEVTATIARGWHINSNRPLAEYYVPTTLGIKTPSTVNAGAIEYPTAREVTLAFAKGEKLSVFTGTVEFRIPLTASSEFKNNVGSPATLKLNYQACNDNECLRPTSVSSTIDLASAQPLTPDASGSVVPAAPAGASSYSATEADLSEVFAKHGYLLGFLVVLLGGLALNLTPCVYPLIGVTIAYFGNQGGGPRKVVVLALIYVFGIALMFSGLGVAVALSGGLFGSALENPYVLAGVAAMLLVLAASSFGLFSLQPPQWMMRRAGMARPGYVGALVMGLGMGIVAAPCIGPIVLGLLLMVQRSGSALFGFALFFTLATGLGLPYIGLALAAGSIKRLPRSGEWLAWVEQLFGFVLVGLALYFLAPIVAGGIISKFLPYYAVAVGIFMGFVTPVARAWRPFVVFRTCVGLVAVGFLVYLLVPSGASNARLVFKPFSRSSLVDARVEHKPVVLDFSADWCVPCREMEHTTFTDAAVVREARGFVKLRANLTSANAKNDAIVKHFGIEGVPTTVFIDSAGKIRLRRVGYIGPRDFLRYLREYQ